MFKKIFLFLVVFAAAALMIPLSAAPSKSNIQTFEVKDGQFLLNGKPFEVISGEMHYERIPYQYWRHRLKMLKAMGANTVATYVFWNMLEPEPNVWNFKENNNLASFIKIAQEEGLYVILRPGPYACAEWEFGGFPWWLQNIKGMDVRSNNEPFLKQTKDYFNHLSQQVKSLQITNGGPIIMVQIENEFGSYAAQRKEIALYDHQIYNGKIKDQIIDAGFNVPLFTADGDWLFEQGSIKGFLPTANGETNVTNLKNLVDKFHDEKGPYMIGEFYSGWLTHWGEPFAKGNAHSLARQTENFLKNGISFNYYMVHGGTNFGFMSGANYNAKHDIQPDITSYDYGAPISEAGWRTPEYDSIRNVIKKYVKQPLPKIPAPLPVIRIPSIRLTKIADVMGIAQKKDPILSDSLLTFEELNQGYGYVLYTKHFNQPITGKLHVKGLRDYAIVYLDGEKVGELNRMDKKYSLDIDIPFNSTLEILVENMGRINYGPEMNHNNKGIISPIKIDENEIDGDWQMFKLPMDKCPNIKELPKDLVFQNTSKFRKDLLGKPILYDATFRLNRVGDTFLNMTGWEKGIVFVNGHNLGRYWNVGPQKTLYLPGVWLKRGMNKLVIFEQINTKVHTAVSAIKTPIFK